MNTRSGLSLFFALTIVALAGLSCSDRSPVSPGSIEENGFVKLDLRLSKVSEQAIDKVLVTAEHPSMEPVSGELTVTGKTATGSLEVLPGKWRVVVDAFSGNTLCYHGEIGPVDVVAGKSTDIPSMKLHATRDLVADRIFIADTDWNELDRVEEGREVLLVLVYKNTGSAEAVGWREEAFLNGAEHGHTNDMALGAGETKRIGQKWTAVAGTHTVEFRLDTENVIGENDESNNTINLTFTIQPPIDLIAEEVFITRAGETEPIDPNSLIEGDEVDLKVRVRNTSSSDIAGWRAQSYIDGKAYLYGDDFSVGAHSAKPFYATWTAVAGTHTVTWTVDTENVIKESDETNNTAELFFTVQSSGPGEGIIAGQSIEGVQIGFTKDQVIGTLGPPDERDEDGDFWYHSGIGAWFDEDGRTYVILAAEPYPGITERGIGLGTPASQIVDKYGTDYTIRILDEVPAYWYKHSGIAFSLDESNICVSIGVFAVGLSGPGGGIVAGESIEDIEIGFTRREVIDEVGEPLSVDEDGSFHYDSAVVQFDENNRVRFIMVIPPYSGITERGIGLGAVASEVKRKYGEDFLAEPMPEFSAYMFTYVKLGIAFMFDQESNICIAIAVFRPPAAKVAPAGAPSEAQETMRALWSASLNEL